MEKQDEPGFRDGRVRRPEPFVEHLELLVERMELDALEARVGDSAHLVDDVSRKRIHGRERRDAVGRNFLRPLEDAGDLLLGGRDARDDRDLDARVVHRAEQARDRAVVVRVLEVRAVRDGRDGTFGQEVRKRVRMEIYGPHRSNSRERTAHNQAGVAPNARFRMT